VRPWKVLSASYRNGTRTGSQSTGCRYLSHLAFFGLCIHGCVDGYSRYILWLNDDNHSTRSPKRVKTTATDDSFKSKIKTPTLTNDRDFKIPLTLEC